MTNHDPTLSTHGTSIKTPKIFFLTTNSADEIAVTSVAIFASKPTVTSPGVTMGLGEMESLLIVKSDPAANKRTKNFQIIVKYKLNSSYKNFQRNIP